MTPSLQYRCSVNNGGVDGDLPPARTTPGLYTYLSPRCRRCEWFTPAWKYLPEATPSLPLPSTAAQTAPGWSSGYRDPNKTGLGPLGPTSHSLGYILSPADLGFFTKSCFQYRAHPSVTQVPRPLRDLHSFAGLLCSKPCHTLLGQKYS